VDLLDPDALKKRLRPGYAAVLLDAPCSGVGVLRRHPEARRRLTPSQVQELSFVQQRLLANLAPFVMPGGVLVYAVCSFLSTEGPAQTSAFLAGHPGWKLLPPPKNEPPWQGRPWPLRTSPQRDDADGFYAVRFLRLD
jgi:16S rRNA (cytosine967-C5)-methyltransferase